MTHLLELDAQARCHMASEKMVAVKREAGIAKMDEKPDCTKGERGGGGREEGTRLEKTHSQH